MTDNEMRVGLLLAAQRALLGQVPPTLRTVSVGVRDSVIYFRAVFEPAANEDDRGLLSDVATMILADFADAQMDEEYLVIAPPTRPPHLKWLVFQRWEPQSEDGGS